MIRQLLALLDIQKAVYNSSDAVQDSYDLIVNNRAVMPQAIGAAIEVIDGDMLTYAAVRDDRGAVKAIRLALVGSLSGLSIMAGRPYICHDSETDSRVDLDACRRVGLRSMIVTPIPYRGENIGVLKYYSDQRNAFGDFDQLVCLLLVGIIAISLSRISETQALEMQGQLIHSAQLKQEFVSMVSHELKTPISSILGALPLAEDAVRMGNPAASEHFLEIAHRNADRLKRLVNDLMDVHQLDEGNLALKIGPVELVQLVERARADLAPTVNAKGLHCQIESGAQQIWIRSDPGRLSQVVVNLLANAIRFSPKDGVVHVGIDTVGDRVRIAVQDEGPGIPADFQQHLFSRFSTANHGADGQRNEGTGLGLFISRRIMEELSGSIEFDPSYDQGARFIMTLPRGD